jgi:hypothetical protein
MSAEPTFAGIVEALARESGRRGAQLLSTLGFKGNARPVCSVYLTRYFELRSMHSLSLEQYSHDWSRHTFDQHSQNDEDFEITFSTSPNQECNSMKPCIVPQSYAELAFLFAGDH